MSCYDCDKRREREWAEDADLMHNYDPRNPPTEVMPDGTVATVMYDPYGPQPDTARWRREDPEGMAALEQWLDDRIARDHEDRILYEVGRDLGLTTMEICKELAPGSSHFDYELDSIESLIDQGLIVRKGRTLRLTDVGRERIQR